MKNLLITFLLLFGALSSFQIDDIEYVLIRQNLKSKDCDDGLTTVGQLYSETYLKLWTCVTIPSLSKSPQDTNVIKVEYYNANNSEFYNIISCPSQFDCIHYTGAPGNETIEPCTRKKYMYDKCTLQEINKGYTIVERYRTIWKPSSIFYLPYNYPGILSGLYEDSTCSKRLGYHFQLDTSYENETNFSYHISCTEDATGRLSSDCKPVESSVGKTFMKQLCLQEGPHRSEWFWVGISCGLLFFSVVLMTCQCICHICDRESVYRKVEPMWERTYTYIQDDDSLDAERESINRMQSDITVKVKRFVYYVRKFLEFWHIIAIKVLFITSILSICTYTVSMTVWIFLKYLSMESAILSGFFILEILMVFPACSFGCYCLYPTELVNNWQCIQPYCAGIGANICGNFQTFFYVLLTLYFFYYTCLLSSAGMIEFDDLVWVYIALFLFKTFALVFTGIEIAIRTFKLLLGLKGIISWLVQMLVSLLDCLEKYMKKSGIVSEKPNYTKYYKDVK